MITVHNLQIIEDLPFDEYLEIKRKSHSIIKDDGKPFKETPKIRLGSQVDNYLNEVKRFDGDLTLVKPLATTLVEEVSLEVYNKLFKQTSVFADFEYKGLVMEYKGRTDWFYPNSVVIDIKVSQNIIGSMDYFGYPDAMNGYCIALGIPRWIIMAVNPKRIDKKTKMHEVKKLNDQAYGGISHYFWERQVMRFGKPLKKYI
jgi:hypothetical protein